MFQYFGMWLYILEFSRGKIFKKKTQNKALIKLNFNFIIYFYESPKSKYFKWAEKKWVWTILQKGDLELTKGCSQTSAIIFTFTEKQPAENN